MCFSRTKRCSAQWTNQSPYCFVWMPSWSPYLFIYFDVHRHPHSIVAILSRWKTWHTHMINKTYEWFMHNNDSLSHSHVFPKDGHFLSSHFPLRDWPEAYLLVQCWAVLRNISGRSLYWRATTASCGSSGSAAAIRACRESSTVRSVIAAAHWSFRMSRQMAPVTDEMFGCQMRVRKRTLGGLNGYVSGILISSTKRPPS